MKHVLAGDIGGTKTALSLYAVEGKTELKEVASARFASNEYSGLLPIVHEFLRTATGGSVARWSGAVSLLFTVVSRRRS